MIYSCEFCPINFISSFDHRNHLLSCHSVKMQYRCKECQIILPIDYKRYLIRRENGVNCYQCNFCSTFYYCLEYVKNHVKSQHIRSNFVCTAEKCKFESRYRSRFGKHLQSHKRRHDAFLKRTKELENLKQLALEKKTKALQARNKSTATNKKASRKHNSLPADNNSYYRKFAPAPNATLNVQRGDLEVQSTSETQENIDEYKLPSILNAPILFNAIHGINPDPSTSTPIPQITLNNYSNVSCHVKNVLPPISVISPENNTSSPVGDEIEQIIERIMKNKENYRLGDDIIKIIEDPVSRDTQDAAADDTSNLEIQQTTSKFNELLANHESDSKSYSAEDLEVNSVLNSKRNYTMKMILPAIFSPPVIHIPSPVELLQYDEMFTTPASCLYEETFSSSTSLANDDIDFFLMTQNTSKPNHTSFEEEILGMSFSHDSKHGHGLLTHAETLIVSKISSILNELEEQSSMITNNKTEINFMITECHDNYYSAQDFEVGWPHLWNM